MKKLLLSILFLMVCSTAHAATTWYGCSGGGNWNGASVWTSVIGDEIGCIAATGNPVAGDTAILNANSGNITISAAAAAAVLDETGYTGTLAFGTQTLTLTSNANLGSAMTSTSGTLSMGGGTLTLLSTVTGTFPTIKITSATTLTAGSYTWPGALTFAGASAQTVTLSNSGATWTNTGLLSITTNVTTLNLTTTGDTLTLNGGLTQTAQLKGTANIIVGGGTLSGSGSSTGMGNNLTISGNVTFSSVSFFSFGTGSNTLTYSSGTVTTTGSTLNLFDSCTLNTNGIVWNNIGELAGGNQTYTLTSAFTATGTYIIGNAQTTFSGAYPITLGTLSMTNARTLKLVAGQVLNIISGFSIASSLTTATIQSATPSSPTYINYTGTRANQNIDGAVFTDVQASGNTLYNYNGGTLTRTNNIKNVNASNINPKATNYALGV